MENLNLSNYINKQTGDSLTAELWNKVFEDIQDKVNELVAAQVDTKTDTTTIVSNNNLFINGKLYTDDVITLAAGNTYKMEGTYTG
jgi:predicted DNA binding CopG/RHH family protein